MKKLKPQKKQIIAGLVVIGATLPALSVEKTRNFKTPVNVVTTQESILVAGCDFTCLVSCSMSNRC